MEKKFSTASYNFRHRFTEETVSQIFGWILAEAAEAGYLSTRAVFIDGPHIKANANVKKQVKTVIPVVSKRYARELMKEVNADRDTHGKRRDNTAKKKLARRKKDKTRTVTKSMTDPDCGLFVKGSHPWWQYVYDAFYDCIICPEYQKRYKKRKETIERVFADAKQKHAMRYAQYRGLTQVTNWVKLKYAAMNLKKLAN